MAFCRLSITTIISITTMKTMNKMTTMTTMVTVTTVTTMTTETAIQIQIQIESDLVNSDCNAYSITVKRQ